MAQLHFYLDARKLRKDGTAPLKLSVYLSGARAMIATEITLQPQQWDAASERVVNHPRRLSLNTFLDGYRADVDDAHHYGVVGYPGVSGCTLPVILAGKLTLHLLLHFGGRQSPHPFMMSLFSISAIV